MAKYKVGDKVLVRTDLYDDDTQYWMEDKTDYWYFLTGMEEYRGKVVTIAEANKNYYHIEEDGELNDWSDEMFSGLADEKPREFKVGDRIKATCELSSGRLGVGDLGTIIVIDKDGTIGVEFDKKFGGHDCGDARGKKGHCWWVNNNMIVLVEEAKPETPEPMPEIVFDYIEVVDLYENACWYCRKGGLVDLYLKGVMAICPSCGRVCNNTRPKGFTLTNTRTVVFEAPKAPKRENKPLTKEELEALPDDTKVYIVWRWDVRKNCKTKPNWNMSGWGVKNGMRCEWEDNHHQPIRDYDRCFDAYLEEPERK